MKIVFTLHAKVRLERRKILKAEAIDAIKMPDTALKKQEKYYFQKKFSRGKIEVVCEKTSDYLKVITVYWV